MNEREQRGVMIAAKSRIRKNGDGWLVPSQTEPKRNYNVYPDGDGFRCTCPDHEIAGCTCKHIYAVRLIVEREENDDGSITETATLVQTVKRTTYPQNWPAYNAAQTNEKSKFQTLLRDLCKGIDDPKPTGRGRPSIPLADTIFAAVFKVYSTVSGRRFMSDLRDAHDKGHIRRIPCYNSIFNVLESPDTFEVLRALVVETAAPLKAIESNFACDSSGFSGCRFDKWFDHKWGENKKMRTWVKAHVMTGVKTNVITAVEIHGNEANDGAQLKPLLAKTRERFTIAELSGDKAYLTVSNLEAVADAGAKAFIPFKVNSAALHPGIWNTAFHFFHMHRDQFLARYHQRSNIESTFSMLKAKFGDGVRSKDDIAMKNEVLAKIVCHNICCLISAMYELGVDPIFWAEKPVAQEFEQN